MRVLTKLKESAQQFQHKLIELGYSNKVIELPNSTRTAKEAAEAIGCEVNHIAKSIIFRLKRVDKPLLVVACGANRINEKQIKAHLNDTLGKADADFVREQTGYVIGGVPPLGHKEQIITLIDEDLFQYGKIWAAAGHPKAVFPLTPDELVEMTNGEVVCVI
nr:YbaK/EbsC family protein [Pseudogracilibacillus auburnensis]